MSRDGYMHPFCKYSKYMNMCECEGIGKVVPSVGTTNWLKWSSLLAAFYIYRNGNSNIMSLSNKYTKGLFWIVDSERDAFGLCHFSIVNLFYSRRCYLGFVLRFVQRGNGNTFVAFCIVLMSGLDYLHCIAAYFFQEKCSSHLIFAAFVYSQMRFVKVKCFKRQNIIRSNGNEFV